MNHARVTFVFFVYLLCCGANTGRAQPAPRGVYVIFDASGSMWGQLPDRSYKIHVARDVLGNFLTRDFGGASLAFRAYGHRQKGDCRDSQLVASFDAPQEVADRVRPFLNDVDPLGMTPIAYSLEQALGDFDGREGEIILITDGVETCDADPCALVRDWKASGVKVNVHVVGFGVEEKEQVALQCIADAAGTPYREAESGMDLTLGLEAIQASIGGGPGDPPANGSVGLWLRGITGDGEPIRIEGELIGGENTIQVGSNQRNQAPKGVYTLRAGVQTANGTLYAPVSQSLEVKGDEDTEVTVEVAVPPSVRARFVSAGEPVRGSTITAFRDDEEVFSFRWMDEVFVEEGDYTFRASPNNDNVLELNKTVLPGEQHELLFTMTPTVRAVFKMVASGSGIRLRGNYTLWQDGEQRYQVHTANGADILPGRYDVRLENELIPYVAENVQVEVDGEMVIEVPAGHVTFIYQDATGAREADKRVFLGRGPEKRGRAVQSGQRIALTPGVYNAVGWPANTYETVVFEVLAGGEQEIVLK